MTSASFYSCFSVESENCFPTGFGGVLPSLSRETKIADGKKARKKSKKIHRRKQRGSGKKLEDTEKIARRERDKSKKIKRRKQRGSEKKLENTVKIARRERKKSKKIARRERQWNETIRRRE